MYCNILITKPFNHTFTYKLKPHQSVTKGNIVLIPFGKKNDQIGMVYETYNSLPTIAKNIRLKEIKLVFVKLCFTKKLIEFIDWIANYTLAPKGMVLKLFLVNKKIIEHDIKTDKIFSFCPTNLDLNIEQQKAFKVIDKSLVSKYHPIVLEGVTGSGKTEVYFEAIEKILTQKKQALILLPEISLTPQLEKRFKQRFGFYPDIWHSKITEKNRKDTWHRCYQGFPMIVVGARSSLFLPFKNLGLIIVDEEHDLSFKQEDNIRYQARDLAIVRAQIEKFPIILSSATPSLETYNNINKKKFTHIYLPSQFSGLKLPDIELINLQNEKFKKNNWISKKILKTIGKCLEKGEQSLLFLNRRGYSPLTLCQNCGYRYQCNHCTFWLVQHKQKNRLLCHHCGTIYPILSECPKCNKPDSLKLIGPGVERLAEELNDFFPQHNIGIMSSDNTNTTNKIKKIIHDFENKKIDILVATQIMAKGYHFPNLSFVGVIDADAGLMGGDIRAIERTYNLLQQVSGRAGRTNKPGKVLIQTYYPNQPLIQSFKNRDRKSFIKRSLKEREQFNIPPFSYMTAIIISSSSKARAESYSNELVKGSNLDSGIDFLGPVEAPLFLLRGQYRYRLLLKGDRRQILNNFTRNLIKKYPPPSYIRLIIDVDPYTFV